MKMRKTGLILILIYFTLKSIGNIEGDPTAKLSVVKGNEKSGIIKGVIVDGSTKQPMEYANVAIYESSDSSLITGGITDASGEFEITGVPFGDYYLEANFIGFDKKEVNDISLSMDNQFYEIGEIGLNPSTHELKGIEVVADKSPIEYKLDKKVVNVSQVITAVGGTAVDVLENTPSVQVDIEGNVSLRGSSSFTVLIDGRPSVLSGSDALRQIPSSAIEKIEIITNPSAKYEPDGNAGIINLVMKKNAMNGINGIVNTTVGVNDKYRGDFTLNYRKEKFNVFFGADWRDETYYGTRNSERETFLQDTTEYLNMNGSRDYTRGGHNFKAGVDLYLTDNSTFTISGEQGTHKGDRSGEEKVHNYTIPASEEIFSLSEETSERTNDFYSVNLNFQHKFSDEDHKIEAMAFYSSEDGDDFEEEGEIFADSDYNKLDEYIERISTLEAEKEEEFRFKLDYTWPFSDDGRLEAGLQSRIRKDIESQDFQDYDQNTDTWTVNDTYSSTTDFRRDIHAVYSTYANKVGGMEFMGGLRGELTHREILNTNIDKASTLNRFDLFPTLHLSYPIGEKTELMSSYSRRIDRPGGWDLDPSPNYFNRYTIRFGNPDLKPEYTNSYEFGGMQRFGDGKSYVSLDAFRRITNNKIERIETLSEDGIIYMNTDNFDKDYSTGFELTGNVNLTDWFLVNTSLSMYNYKITGDLNGESLDRESTNWNGRLNTTFKLADNSRMQIFAYFRGPSVSAQGESKSSLYSNISYRHEFFERKLSATLSVRDPLGTAAYENESFGDNFRSYYKYKRESQVVMLTLSYKINNFKSDEKGNADGGNDIDMGGGEM